MRKNKYSSTADRRWQRRYKRIQQRKEERERWNTRCKDAPDDYFSILEAFSRDAENYRADMTTDDWFDTFMDVRDVALGDRAIFGVDLAGCVEIHEPDLDSGDNSALDSFLDEFLAPGA